MKVVDFYGIQNMFQWAMHWRVVQLRVRIVGGPAC